MFIANIHIEKCINKCIAYTHSAIIAINKLYNNVYNPLYIKKCIKYTLYRDIHYTH